MSNDTNAQLMLSIKEEGSSTQTETKAERGFLFCFNKTSIQFLSVPLSPGLMIGKTMRSYRILTERHKQKSLVLFEAPLASNTAHVQKYASAWETKATCNESQAFV